MAVYMCSGLEDAMRYSTRLSDAVHILVFVALNGDSGLTSERIAGSIRTNPAHVRKLMADLKRAGIIINTPGHPQPALARNPSEISLLDVYSAVDGCKALLHLDTNTNPECCEGMMIQASLKDFYDDIQMGVEERMASVSLEDVIDNYWRHCGIVGLETGQSFRTS